MGKHQDASTSAGEEIRKEILQLLVDDLGLPLEVLYGGRLFSKGGLGSFDQIRLVELLGERFDIHINWEHVMPENFESLDSIVSLVRQVKSRG